MKTIRTDNQRDKQKTHWSKSIQSKVSFFLVLFTTAALIVLGLFQIYKIKQELEVQLVVTNQNTASKLSSHIELPMWQLDEELVNKSLESEFLANDIYAITVSDESGKLFAGFKRGANWEVAPVTGTRAKQELARQTDLVTSTRRISHKSRRIGEVTVFSTKRFNQDRIQQQFINQVIAILSIGLILIIITFIVLRVVVIGRVNKLSDIAMEMSNGNFMENLDAQSTDELGRLSSSLNMLNKSYQMARDQLKSA